MLRLLDLRPSLTFTAVAWVAVVLLGGCDNPERPMLKPLPAAKLLPTDAPLNDREVQAVEPPSEVADRSWETWDAYFVNGEQVGYSHVVCKPSGPITTGSIYYTLDHRVYRRQGKARILQRLLLNSSETGNGRLIEFAGQLQNGPMVTRITGTMGNGKLIIESIDDSSSEVREIPWEPNYRGLFALEQSLRAKPLLTTGETRTIKFLLTGQYRAATARLRCSGPALVPLIDGTESELIEINLEITMPGAAPIYSAIWTNGAGEIKRTYSPAANMIAYRTTRERATDLPRDDLVPVTLEVDGQLQQPAEAQRVAFRLTPLDPAKLPVDMEFAKVPGQYVRINDQGVADILVSRILEAPNPEFETAELPPTEADWRFNYFIDSRSELVKKFASAAVEKQSLTKQQAAEELTETANRLVRFDAQSIGLVKASEVARVAKGNSTQSAILLAALLRAEHIPSRLAIGLKYDPEHQRMVSHVWTMAHTDAGWIYLDALDGQPAAADRLVFWTTNFAERDESDSFATLLEAVGRIQLEILAAKYPAPEQPPLARP